MNDKILIIEDEIDIAKLIKVHLSELDLHCDICTQGDEGLQQALSQNYQLILLDIMLPNINGLDICRQVRQEKPLQSIIMLTSKASEIDRILGLELGADDYMTKPFSIRELQARVRSQLRRVHAVQAKNSLNESPNKNNIDNTSTASIKNNQQVNNDIKETQAQQSTQINNQLTEQPNNQQTATTIGQLQVDHRYHQVTYKDKTINLTATEFELIDFFCKHPDQVFSRTQLLDGVWGYHHSGYEHTVNSHINRLRNKLEEDCTAPQIIQTVWGVGYKLNSAGVMPANV
ncbi:response regulator transcription factor [Colwellia echini]|uniref:Response regulator transcription factor n=1 Tax=Colwellia echini TaxID=1982103 RepID=A0ABY3MVZ6_9GAMM|nr:response regulator transcription factor [Colwellia echini]TYK65376.1 response regulator transcription factor [Colwellia echini]